MARDPFLQRVRMRAADPMEFAEAVAKAIAADDTLYAEIAKYVDLDDQHMVGVLVKDALSAMLKDADDDGNGEDQKYGYDDMGLRSRKAANPVDPTGQLTSGTGLPRPMEDEDKKRARKTGGRLDGRPFMSRKSKHGGRLDGRRLD